MLKKRQAIAKQIIAPGTNATGNSNLMQVTDATGNLFRWETLSSFFVREVFEIAVAEYNAGRDYLALEQVCWALLGDSGELSEECKEKVWGALTELGRTFVSVKLWLGDTLHIYRGPLLPVMTIDIITADDHEWGINIMDTPYAQGWSGKSREQPIVSDNKLFRYQMMIRSTIWAALIAALEESGATQIIIPLEQFYSKCQVHTAIERLIVQCGTQEILTEFAEKRIIKEFCLQKEITGVGDTFILKI